MKPAFTDYQAASILQRYLKLPVRNWCGGRPVRCLICRQPILPGQPYLVHSCSARSRSEVIHSACFSEEWLQRGLACLKAYIVTQQTYIRRKKRMLDLNVAWQDRQRRDLRALRRKAIAQKAAEARWGKKKA